jgi:phosphoglucomutase
LKLSPLAGKPAPVGLLVDVPRLIDAYYSGIPDPAIPEQRIVFGTSGHRGSSLNLSFNEWHILAITQAICMYRARARFTGPLFMGFDTHALSRPAFATALEVLAANGVDTKIATNDEFTPTPAISHAILTHNSGRLSGLSDGIVITPSHNPPHDGGFKYNPPSGGPAPSDVTLWIEAAANALLETKVAEVKRMPYERALRSPTTERHDFLGAFVEDLKNVVDLDIIRRSGIRLGVDPLGGAGVHYWARIAECHHLNLTVVSEVVDPTFSFMTVDWDGQIRMDPSSPYAMQRLIGMKDAFDLSFACDTDHDRHGIVIRGAGLVPPNHDLSTCISYLLTHRSLWARGAAIGKTAVSSSMIDRVTAKAGRKLFEVPVGFKWFVDGLLDRSLGFAGEESAGSTFLRLNGAVWTTDKDGFAPCLLSAEMTARSGVDPGNAYKVLAGEFGETYYARTDAPATAAERAILAALSPKNVELGQLGGERVESIISQAPGNAAPLGGIKVASAGGWFAARPSGTENIFKIYAESFHGPSHLRRIQEEAQQVVSAALAAHPRAGGLPGPIGEPGTESKAAHAPGTLRAAAEETQTV